MSDEKPGSGPIDEGRIRDHLGEMVRGTVEETLNALERAQRHYEDFRAAPTRSVWTGRAVTRFRDTLQTIAGEAERKPRAVCERVNIRIATE